MLCEYVSWYISICFMISDQRVRVIEAVRIFACLEFVLGFLLLFFAFYCIYLHEGPTTSGALPYYAGGHFTGFPVSHPPALKSI